MRGFAAPGRGTVEQAGDAMEKDQCLEGLLWVI